jgi:transcriptional regulator with XRE-family HTH domain
MTNQTNRSQLARERAGLSIGQAASLLNMSTSDLSAIEERATIMPEHANRLAEVYQVRVEWLAGEVELRDYSVVDGMNGAENISPHDRDAVAEFAASMPRRKQ